MFFNIAMSSLMHVKDVFVLIGTEDFDLLTPQFKARIAPHDLLQQLCDIGLIEVQELETSNAAVGTESAQTSAPANNSVKASFPHFPESNIQTSITSPAPSADLEAPITTTLVTTTHVPDVPADITYSTQPRTGTQLDAGKFKNTVAYWPNNTFKILLRHQISMP